MDDDNHLKEDQTGGKKRKKSKKRKKEDPDESNFASISHDSTFVSFDDNAAQKKKRKHNKREISEHTFENEPSSEMNNEVSDSNLEQVNPKLKKKRKRNHSDSEIKHNDSEMNIKLTDPTLEPVNHKWKKKRKRKHSVSDLENNDSEMNNELSDSKVEPVNQKLKKKRKKTHSDSEIEHNDHNHERKRKRCMGKADSLNHRSDHRIQRDITSLTEINISVVQSSYGNCVSSLDRNKVNGETTFSYTDTCISVLPPGGNRKKRKKKHKKRHKHEYTDKNNVALDENVPGSLECSLGFKNKVSNSEIIHIRSSSEDIMEENSTSYVERKKKSKKKHSRTKHVESDEETALTTIGNTSAWKGIEQQPQMLSVLSKKYMDRIKKKRQRKDAQTAAMEKETIEEKNNGEKNVKKKKKKYERTGVENTFEQNVENNSPNVPSENSHHKTKKHKKKKRHVQSELEYFREDNECSNQLLATEELPPIQPLVRAENDFSQRLVEDIPDQPLADVKKRKKAKKKKMKENKGSDLEDRRSKDMQTVERGKQDLLELIESNQSKLAEIPNYLISDNTAVTDDVMPVKRKLKKKHKKNRTSVPMETDSESLNLQTEDSHAVNDKLKSLTLSSAEIQENCNQSQNMSRLLSDNFDSSQSQNLTLYLSDTGNSEIFSQSQGLILSNKIENCGQSKNLSVLSGNTGSDPFSSSFDCSQYVYLTSPSESEDQKLNNRSLEVVTKETHTVVNQSYPQNPVIKPGSPRAPVAGKILTDILSQEPQYDGSEPLFDGDNSPDSGENSIQPGPTENREETEESGIESDDDVGEISNSRPVRSNVFRGGNMTVTTEVSDKIYCICSNRKKSEVEKHLKELEKEGIFVRIGTWAIEETQLLKQNFMEFVGFYNIKDVDGLLFPRLSKDPAAMKTFIQESMFHKILSKNLNRRPIACFDKAKRVFGSMNRQGTFSEDESNMLQELRDSYGNNYQVIGDMMGRTGEAIKDKLKSLTGEIFENKLPKLWTKEEDRKLIKGIQKVLNIKDASKLSEKDRERISWKEVAPFVPSRNASQCRVRWDSRLSYRHCKQAEMATWSRDKEADLIKDIYLMKISEEPEIDWESLSIQREKTPLALKTIWYRMKSRIPNYKKMNFNELRGYLYDKHFSQPAVSDVE